MASRSHKNGLERASELDIFLANQNIVVASVEDNNAIAEAFDSEDLAYVHPLFVQCFLPLRHNARNRHVWQADCGRLSLRVRAGDLVKPGKPGMFKECIVPAGSKARILVAYINDYAYRHNTPEIDLDASL